MPTAAPGLLFCSIACVLLIFVSISAPTWDKISFLNVGSNSANNGGTLHFGVFGFTGSGKSVGYSFPAGLVPNISRLNTTTLHHLTGALILHPIAAALAGLTVLFGLCGLAHRVGTIFMTISSVIAFLVTLVAWIIDMILWGIVRDRIRDQGVAAQYGNANWLTLGALAALVLSFCLGICGTFGNYRKRRAATY